MKLRAGTGLLWLCLASPAVSALAQGAAPGADLATGVERCRQQLRPQDDVGYARVAARCPDLALQLRSSALAPWLPPGWSEPHNDLSAAGLAEMLRLQRQWQNPSSSAGPQPQPQRLRDLVTDLQLQEAGHNSLWKRFRSWLRNIFEKQDRPDGDFTDFGEWLRSHGIGETVWSIAQWTALGLLGLLVARIVLVELRARVRQRRLRAAAPQTSGATSSVPTLAEVDAAPLRQQPGMLLALVADLLSRQRLLRRAPALTANEIALRAPLPEGPQRQQLQALADVADPARFAAQLPEPGLLQRAADAGRSLIANLREAGRA